MSCINAATVQHHSSPVIHFGSKWFLGFLCSVAVQSAPVATGSQCLPACWSHCIHINRGLCVVLGRPVFAVYRIRLLLPSFMVMHDVALYKQMHVLCPCNSLFFSTLHFMYHVYLLIIFRKQSLNTCHTHNKQIGGFNCTEFEYLTSINVFIILLSFFDKKPLGPKSTYRCKRVYSRQCIHSLSYVWYNRLVQVRKISCNVISSPLESERGPIRSSQLPSSLALPVESGWLLVMVGWCP